MTPLVCTASVIVVSAVVVIGAFMAILDTTIVNVALATLSRELHTPLHSIQWVATGYLVALAVVIPLSGWASDRFGAKRLWRADPPELELALDLLRQSCRSASSRSSSVPAVVAFRAASV